MAIKFFCDKCGNEKMPHELRNVLIRKDMYLCVNCMDDLETLVAAFLGGKK